MPFMISFSFKEIWPFHTCWKMVKHTFKFLQCSHRKISKVCLTIFQHYAWREELNHLFFDNLAKRVDISPPFFYYRVSRFTFYLNRKNSCFPEHSNVAYIGHFYNWWVLIPPSLALEGSNRSIKKAVFQNFAVFPEKCCVGVSF